MIHNLRYSESSSLSHLADAWHALGGPADRTAALRELVGSAPSTFQKPPYGTPQYAIALRCGWISFEEEQADRAEREERRKRSLCASEPSRKESR